jgi:hypothetical protein
MGVAKRDIKAEYSLLKSRVYLASGLRATLKSGFGKEMPIKSQG